jgi:hypothetical protein
MGYTVTAALVVSTTDDGRQFYAYQGQQLPEFVKGDQLKRFVDEGLVEETKAPEPDDEPKKPARKSTSSK